MSGQSRTPDHLIVDFAARQHRVVARWQLLDAGLRGWVVDHRLELGWLHPVYRGVYAVGTADLTRYGRWMAGVLACGPHAVLSHRSAADLWGLRVGGSRVEVSVPGARRKRPRSILLHQPKQLPTRDRGWIENIPVTSLARTLVDLAAVVKPERLDNAFEEAERIGELDLRALEEVCARSNGKKGVAEITRLIAERRIPDDTREGMEREFAAILRAAGLPIPSFNVLVEGYVVDALWPDYRLIAEIDSWAFHDKTRKSFEDERVRKNELKLAGYEIVEITAGQMPRAAEIIGAFLSRQAASGRAPAPRS